MAKNDFQYAGWNSYTLQCGRITTLISSGDCWDTIASSGYCTQRTTLCSEINLTNRTSRRNRTETLTSFTRTVVITLATKVTQYRCKKKLKNKCPGYLRSALELNMYTQY